MKYLAAHLVLQECDAQFWELRGFFSVNFQWARYQLLKSFVLGLQKKILTVEC